MLLLWVLIRPSRFGTPEMGLHFLLPLPELAGRPAWVCTYMHQPCLGVPLWARTVVSLCCTGCPCIHPCHPASGIPPSASKSQQCSHFGGKYKKPSSGHLEGAGLDSKVWIFSLLFGFYAILVLKGLFSREAPTSLSCEWFLFCFHPQLVPMPWAVHRYLFHQGWKLCHGYWRPRIIESLRLGKNSTIIKCKN